MTKLRVVSASIVASALLVAPAQSAWADGPRWSHGTTYRSPAFHGGSYRGGNWHGGGGYWRGGVWWPAAVAGAVIGTAAAVIAAPFVAIGNANANAPQYAPQQYYAPQGYNVQANYPPAATTFARQRVVTAAPYPSDYAR